MFKKELADVSRQTAFFLAAVLVLSAALILLKISRQPYVAIFMPALQAGLLFWALFLGASLFGRERRERAMEYALTLPYSRLGLLGRLAGARAAVLAGLWVVSGVVYAGWGSSYSALHSRDLALFSLPLFVISLSLAPLVENFIALCFISLAAWYLSIPASALLMWAVLRAKGFFIPWQVMTRVPQRGFDALPPEFETAFVIMGLALSILPFAAALLLSFRKFDLRPSAAFIKRYLQTLAVFLAGSVLAGFIAASAVVQTSAYRNYALTADQKIVEFQPFRTTIRSSGKVIPVEKSFFWWRIQESGTNLFTRDETNSLVRLNTQDGTTRLVFKAQKEDKYLQTQWAYGNKIALFSRSASPPSSPLSLIVLDRDAPEGQEPQVIPCRHPFFEAEGRAAVIPYLFGKGSDDGRSFWLVAFFGRQKGPLRLWEDGLVEELFPGEAGSLRTVWFANDLILRIDRDSLKIYRDAGRGEGFRLAKTHFESFSFSSWDFISREIDPKPARAVFGKRHDKIARLDLETLELRDIASLRTAVGAQVVAYFPDRFYLLETDLEGGTARVSSIGDDGLALLREFKNIDPTKSGPLLAFQPGGIVLRQPRKTKVFAFPDLKELRY